MRSNVRVTVIQRYDKSAYLEKNGVSYYFVKDRLHGDPRYFRLAISFTKQVRNLIAENKVDVVHASNPMAISSNYLLGKFVKDVPIIVQDHGTLVSKSRSLKNRLKIFLLRKSLQKIFGLIFSSPGLERDWVEMKLINNKDCFFIMENSSHFEYEERRKNRALTQLNGEPVLLSVGNLDTNKDPMTVLRAFVEVNKLHPKAKLYLIYRSATIEGEVRQFIEKNDLQEFVFLLGSKVRSEMRKYYNSADFIISASHKEGSGYSVIEGMSCGLIPILTNIPSFVDLTNNGEYGALYEVGDSKMLTKRIIELLNQPIEKQRTEVLSRFKSHFSFDAMANNALKVYNEVLDRRPT